jgi:hypothetical protein
MTGALALLFLLAVTLAIVRVAGVALRLTGMPQPVARFQAISALTGTGFTTSEAEGTMHHPVRRRILTMLMFTGHLGLVSLTSTVILTMTASETGLGAFVQVLAMLAAILAICALAVSKTLDRVMCDWVGHVLMRLGWINTLPYEILFEAPDGFQLGEHIVTIQSQLSPDLKAVSHNRKVLGHDDILKLNKGDHLVLYGKPEAHLNWADKDAPHDDGYFD